MARDRYVCVEKQCRAVADGYCEKDNDCSNGEVCRRAVCRDPAHAKYAGESCDEQRLPSECLSGNCFKGSCQCNKQTDIGCPDGKRCVGGTHVVWGTRCE